MKKKTLPKTLNILKDPQESLRDQSYQIALITLKTLLTKMKTPPSQETQDNMLFPVPDTHTHSAHKSLKPSYHLENLDKEEKKILLELIKMQVTADRKMEAIFVKAMSQQQKYDT